MAVASLVHRYTYSNWRAPCGAHLDGGDRTEPGAASSAEAGSNPDTDNIGAGSCSGIEAGKAWRQRRHNGWQGFQVEAVLEGVAVEAEGGSSGCPAFAGRLPRYSRYSP